MARRSPDVAGMHERVAGSLNVAVGGDPAWPTIVLVHGLSNTWRVWRPLLPMLLQRRHVVAVDLPGFGGSSPLPGREYRIRTVSRMLEHALDDLHVAEHDLMGHSLGGGISMGYAADRPERVRSLVVFAPGGFVRYPAYLRVAWRSEFVHRIARDTTRLGEPAVWAIPRLRREIFRRFIHDPTQFSVRDLIWLGRDSAAARSTATAGAAIQRANLFRVLPELTMPSIVVWGDDDRIVPPTPADEIAATLPDCRALLRFPETGHLAIWERTAELEPRLATFLDSTELASRSRDTSDSST